MPKRVSDYYYIFDGRSDRPVIVDRASGVPTHEAPPSAQPAALPVARYLKQDHGASVVRAFACWCAQQTWRFTAPPAACTALWTAARNVASGQVSTIKALHKARSASREAAVRAAAIGMPHRRPSAAQLLAARSCTEPDVLTAAHDAMHMSVRWAEFAYDPPNAAIKAMHERHMNGLLDALNGDAPFQQPCFFADQLS
ncbi:MAG: hypothetical protein R6U20_04735 [Longimonas sp.]|uniref:hypothetical protein n=1 Tax=Longimonas sp. TaxID=2039626 RepID=UPI003975C3EC